jgi:glycosyltransferase involved in cell wall biosynthesis
MWKGKKVSVVFPTYKEKRSIRKAINEFDSSGFIDEIIVVNNNAEKGTDEEVKKTRAKLIFEEKQGYGYAIKKGLDYSKADLLIIAEPDGTFDGKDVVKLLSYSDDFEMVFGSRTHRPLLQKGSDMTLIKRLGDVLLGKLVNILFLCYPLTDLGCTLRLTHRASWQKIAKQCKTNDGLLATEWVLRAAKNKIKFIEIPINFRGRIGESALSNTSLKRIGWGVKKFFCIWKVWAGF